MSQKHGAVPNSSGKEEKVTGFIEALSQIEGYHIMERQSGGIPGDLNTTRHKIEFWTVGFLSVVKTMPLSFIIVPICAGAFYNLVPIYGSAAPTWFDYFIIFLLAVCFCLGYSVFMAKLGNLYEGFYTRSMIRNFLSGVAVGAGTKIFFSLALFHLIALKFLDQHQLAYRLLKLQGMIGEEWAFWLYQHLKLWKEPFIISAWFLTITTSFYIFVPLAVILMKTWSDKKKLALGGRQL